MTHASNNATPLEISFGGGINEVDDFNISLEECISGQNFKLNPRKKTLTPRPPQDLKGTATNAEEVTGILQLIKRDDSETTLVVAGDTIYDWDGASSFTSKTTVTTSTGFRDTYWSLDDIIIINDLSKNNVLLKWNGSTITKLKNGITAGAPISTTITRSGSTATAIATSHGFSTDDLATIAGADQTDYNGEYQITVSDADTFTYAVSGTPATPATGTITSDKNVDLYAKYSVIFNNRVWQFNITSDATASPHMCLASTFENAENYDTSTRNKDGGLSANDAFFMLSPDLRPINGVVEFLNQLIISTVDGKLFKLTGSSATDYDFKEFYSGSAATGTESIVNVGNDVAYMKRGGPIDLLSSTDRFGDIAADDVSRWIIDTTDGLTSTLPVYDQKRQLVYFFVTDKILVLDKDALIISEHSPWTIWNTLMSNKFNTKAARYLRVPGGTDYTVYWGDSAGQIFDINGTGTSGDAGTTSINIKRKTRDIEELRTIDEILSGRIEYRRKGAMTVDLIFDWAVEYSEVTVSVPLKAPITSGGATFFGGENYFSSSIYFNQGTVAGDKVSSVGFSPPGKGGGFFVELTTSTTVNFLINKIII